MGLTTALVALRSGFVIVGSLPTSDGTAATAQAGCLIVLDRNGTAVATPEYGAPYELKRTVIASGFPERSDPSALVIGPTGLALARDGRLFVADTLQNRIAAIPSALSRLNDAGTGMTIFQAGALNGPLGLAIAPDGDILIRPGNRAQPARSLLCR